MKAIDLRDARTAAARPRTAALRAVVPARARCAVLSVVAGFRRARPRVPRSATGVVVGALVAPPSIVRRTDGLAPARRTLCGVSGQVPGAPAVGARATGGPVGTDGRAETRGGVRAERHPARKPAGRDRRPQVPAAAPGRLDRRRRDRPVRGAAGQRGPAGCPGGPARPRPGRSPRRICAQSVRQRPCRHPAADGPDGRAPRQGHSGAVPGRPPGTAVPLVRARAPDCLAARGRTHP